MMSTVTPRNPLSPFTTTTSLNTDSMATFKALIFTRTVAYRHDSIPAGIRAIERLASTHKFDTLHTDNPAVFNDKTLAEYKVIVLLQCSGEFLDNASQIAALKTFVRNGGGVVGIHCASFAMQSEPWYARLIGAAFESHPDPCVQTVRFNTEEKDHSLVQRWCTKGMGTGRQVMTEGGLVKEWEWTDEWYVYKETNEEIEQRVRVLLRGGLHGENHPLAWYQEDFEGGTSFYTSLGHFGEAYEDEGFCGHLARGIVWAARVEG
ncbi:ThuA-like domain-containing protein [Podospora australis]|uniref:ThuA-like domain-containing protein n=1 Tax=Podospora australis TaxID=1536484 RepID=A0AAN6WUS4_9PEZI|nr:ThuA-like domain-containing protein [Podospora australis]